MTIRWFRFAAVAALSVGALLAQNNPPAGRHAAGAGMHHMARQLNLTDNQKAQAREIFQGTRESAQPLRQQMRDARQQLATDVKSGAGQDLIAKDSAAVGTLAGQLTAIRAQAFQKFYNILTPEQKTKLDTLRANRRARRNG